MPDILWTAPDLSFTLTRDALNKTVDDVLIDLDNGLPCALQAGHIFATLAMNEGYDDSTARALSVNPFYEYVIYRLQRIIVAEIEKWGTDV